TDLTDIYALRTNPEAYECSTDVFDNVPTSTCTLHVHKGRKEAYKAIEPWNQFENIVEDAKPSTEPADLNGDGAVNVGDVTTLVNMILGKTPMSDDADLNGDGSVNVGDVTTLVNQILGK
ncbi:MAG: dockerin type I repeat-containing protein, partial [Alloprevotella sp.]|nr:dockerin type I repeat-containing protein [Alloprevotella sp.]